MMEWNKHSLAGDTQAAPAEGGGRGGDVDKVRAFPNTPTALQTVQFGPSFQISLISVDENSDT